MSRVPPIAVTDPESLPVPLTPQLPGAMAPDAPRAHDQVLLGDGSAWWAAVLTGGLGAVAGLPAFTVLMAGGLGLLAHDVMAWGMFHAAFSSRSFRRALWLAERLESCSWFSRSRLVCRINRITCHIVLGELDRAKQLMRSLERDRLPARTRAALEVNLGALYIRMNAPDSALAVLDEVQLDDLPRGWRPYHDYHRASACLLAGRPDQARQALDRAWQQAPGTDLEAACLSLKARLELDAGHPARALSLSNDAVRRVGPTHRGRLMILVTHARVVLEATGEVKDCLDALTPVMDGESELWLSVQGEHHWLLAHCYAVCGMTGEAREHLRRASDLPVADDLRKRLGELSAILDGQAAGAALVPARCEA